MTQSPTWQPFDPTWLVELVRAQCPKMPRLADSLAKTTEYFPRSVAYWYFVNPANANKPGAEWQFFGNVHLNGGERGPLVLDVLKDGRVGGVEFLARLGEVR